MSAKRNQIEELSRKDGVGMAETYHVSMEQIRNVAYKTLVSFGFSEADAKYGAEVLYESDIRGVDSHGVARLEFYENMIKKGMINKDAELKIISETPATAYIDAEYGLGIVQAPKAMDIAIEKAKDCGVGLVSVTHGGHFGIAGYYALKAARQDMIGFTFANSAPVMAAFGGAGTVLGNSPFSIAFPKGNDGRESTMIDAACSMVAYGKIQMQDRKGEPLPKGWAVDEDGVDTTDPGDVLERNGSLLPFGGAKGYCLGVMLEMLAAVLPGSATGIDVGWTKTEGIKENLGYFFLAIDAKQFRPLEDVKDDIKYYNDKLKNTKPATGGSEVFLPGELEFKSAQKRKDEGLDLNINVCKDLLRLAIEYGRLPQDATIEDVFK
jgi:L-2-hydroxycarboxylate dehydrogenase (NAD+)